jgi:hypothetical protein
MTAAWHVDYLCEGCSARAAQERLVYNHGDCKVRPERGERWPDIRV